MSALTFKLFKNLFLSVFVLLISVHLMIVKFAGILKQYENNLKSGLSKTYHVMVNAPAERYVDKVSKYIKGYSDIKILSANVIIKKGYYTYSGKVEAIGIGRHYPCGFQLAYIDPRELEGLYDIRLTSLEIYDKLFEGGVIFNDTLKNNLGVVASPTASDYRFTINAHSKNLINYGYYNDLKEIPVIYMGMPVFDDYFSKRIPTKSVLLLKNIDDIQKVINILKKEHIKAYPYYYRTERKRELIEMFKKKAGLIIFIISVLASFAVLFMLVQDFIKKSNQVKILKILGFQIKLYIFFAIFFIYIASFLIVYIFMKKVSVSFEIFSLLFLITGYLYFFYKDENLLR